MIKGKEDIERYIDKLYDEKSKVIECVQEITNTDCKSINLLFKSNNFIKILAKLYENHDEEIICSITNLYLKILENTDISTKAVLAHICEQLIKIFNKHSNLNLNANFTLLNSILKSISLLPTKILIGYCSNYDNGKIFIDNLMSCLRYQNIYKPDIVFILLAISSKSLLIKLHFTKEVVEIIYNNLCNHEEEIVHDEKCHTCFLFLLNNMAQRHEIRKLMLRIGYTQKLHHFFALSKLVKISKIMYLLSLDQDLIECFNGSQIITKMLRNVALLCKKTNSWSNNIPLFECILPALFLNLTTNYQNAKDITDPVNLNSFQIIISKIFENPTTNNNYGLWIKFFKNVASQPQLCPHFKQSIYIILPNFAKMTQLPDLPELPNAPKIPVITFMMEYFDFIGQLTHDPECYAAIISYLIQNTDNLSTFLNLLTSTPSELLSYKALVLFNDLLADSDDFANAIKEYAILDTLTELMKNKQEDDEFVCQLAYAFYRLLNYPTSRQDIINHESVVPIIIDLMNDKNRLIRQICSISLILISDLDPENWGSIIREEAFIRHNTFWLEMVNDTI